MTRIIDWHRFRWRRLGARLALFLFALVLAMPVPGLHARAREGRDARGLAGWWVAIDETFAKLARRGDMRPAEEVLIVNADGRVEDRVMNFWSGAADICARAKVCGDLPAIADARLRLKGDMLSFAGVRARRERVE
ncbi:MAG: hypothetical protein HY056_08265, partial [Proteobacteria bacterium]|nr:hypothetical protein [Pseudomonadota bacterium]